jgi:hypothetical protein
MVKRGAVRQYKEPDQYAYINVGDKDLIPFRVSLPMPKRIEKVQGYGLMPNDQVVTKEIYPRKLEYLEKEIRAETYKRTDLQSINRKEQVVHEEIWRRLYSDFDKYREEIEWIREQWYYRLYGKWYFVNGKPTWITGDHWFYLNYWHLEQYGKPDYRDRDRRWFLAQYYLMNTTESPKKNRQGHLMYNADGTLVVEDKGSRTVMGSNNVKSRQVGETSKACSIITNRTMRTKEGKSGIQAESGDGSASIFKNKVVLSHRKLPFFFKPTTYNHDPQERLEWKSQNPEYGIDAMLDYASTIYRHFYDKENLNYILVDEAGKLDPRESVKDRHDVLLKCMEVRQGFMFYTTTVEEMDKSAGKEFLDLSKNSHFQDRNETGSTISGLVNVFFPAYDGKFFVGKFGESIVDTPTPDQIPYMSKVVKNSKGDVMGAKEYLYAQRAELEKKGDVKGLISYKRLEPMSFREAFTPPAKGEFFDRHIVETRIGELQMEEKSTVIRGNFEWKDSNDWSKGVTFVPNKDGRWNVSEVLQSSDTNKFVKQRNIYRPNNGNKYILSADAYRAEKTEGGRMSDGGGAVLKVRNSLVDTPDKDVKDWDTERFVCTYLARPGSTDKFSEDMLKTCVYYGAFCYPENNVNHVQIDFERWGYHGYLLYGTNKTTGKKNSVPGFYTSTNKQELFNYVRDWVSKHGLYCEHEEILREVSEIRGLDDMTNYDLFTAVAGALYGQDILVKRNEVRGQTLGMDVSGIFKKRSYR